MRRAPRVSNRPSSCARRPTRVATGSRPGGPTSSEAGTRGCQDSRRRRVPQGEHDLHKAQHHADRAEEEARFAIDFAYSAVVEAEYAVLDAALARVEADDLSGRAPAA